MRRVPIYNVRTWRIRSADSRRIVFRPSWKTFAIRLQATVLFLGIIGAMEYGVRRMEAERESRAPIFTDAEREEFARREAEIVESMRREFDDELVDQVERDVAAERAARQARRDVEEERIQLIARGLEYARYGLYAVLAICGLLPPMSCLWSRVTIGKTIAGELRVFSLGILPRTRIWGQDYFERLRTYAMERYWFGRHGALTKHAWDWYVQLAPPGLAHMPVTMTIAWTGAGEELSPQFLVHRQKPQPGTKDRAPEPVREFVKAMRALTGLPADRPEIVEARLKRGLLGTRVTRSMPVASVELPASHHSQTYASLDEMPPEVREKFRELLESGKMTGREDGSVEVVSRRTFSIGTPIDPADLDKLPPEVRRQVEDQMQRGPHH